jgi:hypothetical protein
MNNAISMSAEFERQKNIRAALLTAALAGTILVMIILIKLTTPVKIEQHDDSVVQIFTPDPPVEDVNLGNNDVGSGKVQPIVTGRPSSAPVSREIAPSKGPNIQQATKDIASDNSKDAPPVTQPVNKNPAAKDINNNTTDQATAPKPQLRKGAQMTSVRGTGNGGNTDLPGFNKAGSQGPGDGPGDKGQVNGNPNGRKYIGIRVVNIPAQNFEDDFNEGGKIALDIAVDGSGKLESASYQAKGSSLPRSSRQYSIALDRAKQIKYPQYDGGFKQTLTFNFTVK